MLKDCIKIIAVICISAAISAYTYWLLYASNNQYSDGMHLIISVICVTTGMGAALLALGAYAHSAGYTQENLERIGDDAMQGRPPL